MDRRAFLQSCAAERFAIARELKVIVAVEEVWNEFLLSPGRVDRFLSGRTPA